jgi:hypothetical protein
MCDLCPNPQKINQLNSDPKILMDRVRVQKKLNRPGPGRVRVQKIMDPTGSTQWTRSIKEKKYVPKKRS